jgi:glycosyltransferase involved in cell wall biosynthesis
MADRVSAVLPDLVDRIVVRFHPLSFAPGSRTETDGAPTLLCPVVNSPYKNLADHLELLQTSLQDLQLEVVCTVDAEDVPRDIRADDRFRFTGEVDRQALDVLYRAAAAVYYPTSIESFGYPLAESRAAGIPVIAQETAHNREIAAKALYGYRSGDARSLAEAVAGALAAQLTPDPDPFDGGAFFDWLLS